MHQDKSSLNAAQQQQQQQQQQQHMHNHRIPFFSMKLSTFLQLFCSVVKKRLLLKCVMFSRKLFVVFL